MDQVKRLLATSKKSLKGGEPRRCENKMGVGHWRGELELMVHEGEGEGSVLMCL